MKVALYKAISEGIPFQGCSERIPDNRIGAPAPDERQIIAELTKEHWSLSMMAGETINT